MRMSKQRGPAEKPIRSRNPVTTRADLLQAARRLFSQQSYELVGSRQIAAEAGFTQGLVIRYFGSKKELFKAALDGLFAPDRWFEGDRKTAGHRMAAWIASKWPQGSGVNPLALLIQSSGHPEVNEILKTEFETQAIQPLAKWLGEPRALERARELASIIIGSNITYQILRSRAFAQPELTAITDLLGVTLQRIVDGSSEHEATQDHLKELTKTASV
jgi:AcrR family transcriptional regulator